MDQLPNADNPQGIFFYVKQNGIDKTLLQLRQQALAVTEALIPQMEKGDTLPVAMRYAVNAKLAYQAAPDRLAGAYIGLTLCYSGEATLYHGCVNLVFDIPKGLRETRIRQWAIKGKPSITETLRMQNRFVEYTRFTSFAEYTLATIRPSH